MFVLEAYLKKREEAIKSWRDAGNKWVKEKQDANGYGYYSFRDWESNHTYPVVRWEKVAQVVIPIVLFLAVAFGIVMLVVHHNPQPTTPKHTVAKTQQLVSFKTGDTVQVVYGDYKDSVGVIVKIDSGEVIIKLTNSSYTTSQAANHGSTAGTDNGQLLTIGSLDNIVPYKEVK